MRCNFSACRTLRLMVVVRNAFCRAKSLQDARAVLWPVDLARALYLRGTATFEQCFLGGREVDVQQYWEHRLQFDRWFQQHPSRRYPDLSKLIPISPYGDDVQTYRNSEVGSVTVVGFTADLSFKSSSLLRYWPVAVYSEYAASDRSHTRGPHGCSEGAASIHDRC